jgi:hypothetical protein
LGDDGREQGGLRVAPLVLIACEAALAVAWVLDFAAFRPPFPTGYQGRAALAPLYAFPIPVLRVQAIAFVVLACALLRASDRLADLSRTSARTFGAALFAAAIVLPLALFWTRQDLRELGSQFEIYRGDEFLLDARRIGSPGSFGSLGAFLANYVRNMPNLSLHGSHFPPGHAVLLFLVGKAFGEGVFTAGAAVLVLFAAGTVVAWRAAEELFPGKPARQAALLLLACPSALDFACTSMDAVFFLFAALALRSGLRAFSARGTARQAILTGVLLLVAAFFSFSTFPLGLALLFYACFSGRHALRRTAAGLALTGAAFAAGALLLDGATGFALWKCVPEARRLGMELMTRAVDGDPRAYTLQFDYGNVVAFAIGAGVALLPALVERLRARPVLAEPWTPAALLALAAMSFSGIYFMETERIWLFALPWVAASAVAAGPFERGSLRLLLGCGLAQALAMEIGLFTLW